MSGWSSLEEALTLGDGVERSFSCPVHDDHSPSASVNSLTGFWYCYACGAWGKADLSRMEIDPLAVRRQVMRMNEKLNPVHQTYPEGWLSVHDAAGPGDYWLSRFDAATCEHFRLGVTLNRDFATIPMRDNSGAVLGVIRRDLVGGQRKYLYPYRVDIGRYIFDFHRCTDDVIILTEGATDTMAVWEAGFNNAMALYGRGMSRAQTKMIKKHAPTMILCAQDQDAAGETAFRRVLDLLGGYFTVRRMVWDTHKDLASIPVDQRREMLSSILQKEPHNRLAIGVQRRVGSETCGSYEPGQMRTSSDATRRPVVLRRRPATADSSSKTS